MVRAMRRLTLLAALFLAGCATTPEAPPPAPKPTPVVQSPHIRSDLIGMTGGELVQRFGSPALQVREGAGLKLQFRGRDCILDAYLYPAPTGGVERVAHVDTRLKSGADYNQASCIAALSAP